MAENLHEEAQDGTAASGENILTSIKDSDRDSLFVMPMVTVPLKEVGLTRARMIKNARLQSVIEMFDDEDTGSGQIDVESAPKQFEWKEGATHPDMSLLRKISAMPSYDVYSLRVLLRDAKIPIHDHAALRLSATKVSELDSYMRDFTRPLIQQIYGGSNRETQNFEGVLQIFRDPDIEQARDKLMQMAKLLEIRVQEIPKFLEDYGDIFLSLGYYRQCLKEIEPTITMFRDALTEIRGNFQLKEDFNLMKTCDMMESKVNELLAAVTGRFENFDRSTKDMWAEMSARHFRKVEELISSNHSTIGGVLCSLTVKMNAWRKLFPTESAGGPIKRAEFIMTEMKQGIDKI